MRSKFWYLRDFESFDFLCSPKRIKFLIFCPSIKVNWQLIINFLTFPPLGSGTSKGPLLKGLRIYIPAHQSKFNWQQKIYFLSFPPLSRGRQIKIISPLVVKGLGGKVAWEWNNQVLEWMGLLSFGHMGVQLAVRYFVEYNFNFVLEIWL